MMVYSRWFAASLKLTDISVQYLPKLAMNKQSKSLGKRSTNTRALSTRITNIQKEINPVLLAGPLRMDPVAKTVTANVWVPRTVKVNLRSSTTATLTLGQIVTALGVVSSTPTVNIKILALKVWNFTSQASTSNYLRVTTKTDLTTNGIVTSAEDYGCSSSLPAVKVNVPDLLSKTTTNVTLNSTTAVADITGDLGFPSVTINPQTFLVEVQMLLQA